MRERIEPFDLSEGAPLRREPKAHVALLVTDELESIAGPPFKDLEVATGRTVSPHSRRHNAGSSLVSGGVAVVDVSRWLAHSLPEITWHVYCN